MCKNLPSTAASPLHTIKRCFSVNTKPPSSSPKNKFYFSLLPILVFLFLSNIGFAQSPNEAEWNGQGYSLKKIVSNNSIPSGVNFSYTIIFSAPAGASNITIVDEVPLTLGGIIVPVPSPVNGVTPSIQINANTVTYALNGLPAGVASSGSFTIVTSFPAGVTCPGTGARNRVGIYIGDKLYHTPFVSTTATAEDPWKISKSIISGVVSNPMGGGCQYLMNEGETVRYRLHVSKKSPFWGNTNGQLNASGAVVSDVLPAGAQLVSSSPNTGTVVQNGNTIEWTIGSLLATIAYTNYTCDIDVYYPAGTFPNGTIVNNQANLNAVICGQSVTHQSNETCIKVDQIIPNANAAFYKQISLTNRVPGCQGYYDIVICNNGNVPFSSYNITDAIPQGITVSSVNVYNADATTTFSLTANNGSNVLSNNISGFYDSGNLSYVVNNLNLTMTNQHPVGKCIFLRVYFTIDSNVTTGQQITNCAVFNGQQNNLTLSDACVTFVAEEGQPRPCLNKDICNVQSDYEPGDTLRFRLRVQNIGSATLSGASLQDVLHSNFSYIGNESYYQATTYNVSCSTNGQLPANTTAWQGVSPSHSGSGLSWNLPDITSDCQLFYVGFCSYYGTWGLPYYFIEFDVVVQDYAMPGVTPNKFEVSGGNLPQTNASNTVYALVVASLGQQINKQVSADNGANYSTSATVAPGSNARYRLSYTNTSNIPLSNIEMVDLLPYNDNTNDWLILNRSVARASQFGVGYTGNHSTSLVPSGSTPTATVDFSAGNNLCLPNYGVNVLGCNAASWNSSPDKNVRINYGLFNLAPAQALNEDFDISVASTIGDNLSSCNDFAAHASANFLLNGSPQSVTLTPIAAPPVCIVSDKDLVGGGDCCKNTILETIQAPELGECCIQLISKCEVDSFHVDISNGTFFSSSWNCGTMPTGYVGQSSYTFDVAQCAVNMKSCITADSTGVVSANYTIYYSNGEVCEKFIDMDCKAPVPTCCDNTEFELIPGAECCVNLVTKCEVRSVEVIVQNGTIGSASWNCGTLPANAIGQSSYTFDANNCVVDMQLCFDANQTGVVFATVNIVFANGETCTKELKVDCKAEASCCENTKLELIPDAACCVNLVTKCEVKSVEVIVQNGTIGSASWNCGTLPANAIGQSSYTFDANNCLVDMKLCFDATKTGVVSATVNIVFANGETCTKYIKVDCKAEASCCENTKLELIPGAACCVNLATKCEVKSVEVIVQNGTIGSASWNCGTLPASAIGQSSYTFDANNCVVDMQLCFDATKTGVVSATVNIVFANGETCTKYIKVDCKAEENCCENTKLELISDNECCVNLVTKCEVKSVEVIVQNGTIGSANWNCGTLPASAIGQSSYTFDANNCAVDMKLCFDATKTGVVSATVNIVFANGETCTKKITLKCQAEEPSSCCPTLDFKMKPSWPLKDTYVGYFSITNPDPNSPICSVKINPVSNGTFSTGNLWIDGNLSGQSWTSSNIPASGSLSPTASNTIDFVLKAKGYKGAIEVCVIKCDGTVCCFEVNWNKKPIIDVVVDVADLSISQKLIAVSVSPYITTESSEKVKYVSFGYLNEDEANDKSKLFAASVSGGACGDAEIYTGEVSMGSHNAFFELACPYTPTKGADLPQFNLVFAGKMPKVACALFNEEGDVIYSGSINVASPDTTTTSVLTTEFGAGSMNELLRLYPNPNTGEFTVSYTVSAPGSVIFQVVNNVGQVLKTEEFYVDKPGLHEHTMSVPNISMGVNHVILKTGQATKSKVFIRK